VQLPRIQSIKPKRIAAPFDHPDFLFELKHDGFRCVAYIEDRKCELVSRKRNVYKSFPTLAASLGALRFKNAILDGEIVCLDSAGHSVFLELLHHRHSRDPIFYAFDLLWLDGSDLRELPLIERKRRLKKLLRALRAPRILCADHVEGHGVELFRAVCARDCEGIVAKHKLAPYATPGPATWFKVLNANYTQKNGRRELFEAFRATQTRN